MRTGSRTHSTTAASSRFARETARLVRRLALETDGQDLIEYALLTTFIGFAGAAAWTAMQNGLGNVYSSYVTAAWNLWEPADPVGGGS
jgi:Flp pilus assembly pilin Flp